jgi:hypothetical protein
VVPNYNSVIPFTPPGADMPRPADLPAILLARAYLAAGVPLTLLLDLSAGETLDSAEIMAMEQAAALVTAERARSAAERPRATWDKRNTEIA